jgi:nucleotide-binding universal stress UspA family protein
VYAAYEYGGLTYFDPDWDTKALAAARAYVDGMVKRVRESGVSADGQAQIGPIVAQTITEVADGSGADLIVMSTQALTGPARAFLGSVADAVVRTAHCPVLLVHRTVLAQGGAQAELGAPALATS